MTAAPEFFLFFPQIRCSVDDVVERAQVAEAEGFTGISFMDHLAPPLAETQPMLEAMTLATWVAARTDTLRVGHLVLCDALRHPAVLARQAVTLDHASGGRFELGLGWGSVATELVANGVTNDPPPERVARLDESLTVIEKLWSGESVVHTGERFQLSDAIARPSPLIRIPVVIGGAGPRTLDVVRRHADWWNLPAPAAHRLDELRPQAGAARVSTQHLVALVPTGADRQEIEHRIRSRFPGMGEGLVVGDARRLRAHFEDLAGRGVQRCYVWFADRAPVDTIAAFADGVIEPLSGRSA